MLHNHTENELLFSKLWDTIKVVSLEEEEEEEVK